jgi:tetratricopeptide (TPR) repeat protein
MRSTILILILLFSLLFVPAVLAEDALDWYTKAQNALTVGNYPLAVTCYDNALQLDRNYASAYAGRAAALNMLERYREAIDSADSGLAIKSMDPVALNARALALFRLGRYEEAAAAYEKLFVVVQNRKEAYCNQAYAYMMLNETDSAIVAYDRCTMLDSRNFEAWNNKGVNLLQAGNYEAALQAFDRATGITIKNATVWNNKGVVLVALGKPSDALECFNKALGIDPDYAEAKANKADAIGRQQSFNISGTITPEATISRIGTFYTTMTPLQQSTAIDSTAPSGDTQTTAEETTIPVPEKTTYAPVSLLTVLGALAAVAGIGAVMRQK